MLRSGTLIYIASKVFLEPQSRALVPFDGLNAPTYCFLISHGSRHIVFDLGVRPDWENYAPRVVALLKAHNSITVGRDVAGLLDDSASAVGISSQDIEAIVWSHSHFDHTGDPSTFPPHTKLVVGPGVTASSWPGFPTKGDAMVLDKDREGRRVEEVRFDSGLKIGRFDALDYFGDGSFYLLDAPGHAAGHMCALARTTAEPPSFVFMGADSCHHAGALRPSPYLSWRGGSSHVHGDVSATRGNPGRNMATPPMCAGDLLLSVLDQDKEKALFRPPPGPLFPDHDAAMDTVAKIQELDALDEVLVILSHDTSIRDQIPLFPEKVNDWKAQGLREKTRWTFLADFK